MADLATERAQIWAAVDALTEPSTRRIERDNGTAIYGAIASLWDQSAEALTGGGESAVRVSSASERSPVDLNLMEARSLIERTTRAALYLRGVSPEPPGVPRQLRQLAARVVTHEPTELWWWAYRFESWARLLANLLAVTERRPTAVRLRNSACPKCATRQVTIDSEDGPVVVPALVIDFEAGLVRAAQCSACLAIWWRGEQLELLADSLRTGAARWAS